MQMYGALANEYTGDSVCIGDVTGDGHNDLIIGSVHATQYGSIYTVSLSIFVITV